MRNYMLGLVLALFVALGSFVSPANAAPAQKPVAESHSGEGRGTYFIVPTKYKKNISQTEFRKDIRGNFRSEAAFDLIVDFTGDTIKKPNLSRAEFISLMLNDSLTRVRDCAPGERIKTGAMERFQNIWGFHWFTRLCRPGEQIVQVLVNGAWTDLFSLNCLNAVEDPTPVKFSFDQPKLEAQPLVPEYRMVRSTTATPVNNSVFLAPFMLPGCPSCCPPAFYGGFSASSSSVDRSTSYIIEEIR